MTRRDTFSTRRQIAAVDSTADQRAAADLRAASRALMTFLSLIAIVFAAHLVAGRPAWALDVEVSGRPVSRAVLAIYDSKQEGAPHLTRLHKLAEMPLNHLGFTVDYRDVNEPLPTGDALAQYRGIVTWFVEPLADPAMYLRWLEPTVESGLKFVMLGEIAPRESDEMIPQINRVLARLGLSHGGTFVDLTYKSKVFRQDVAMIGFEQKLDKVRGQQQQQQVAAKVGVLGCVAGTVCVASVPQQL